MPIESKEGIKVRPGPATVTFRDGKLRVAKRKDGSIVHNDDGSKAQYVYWDLIVDTPEGPEKLEYSLSAYITPQSKLGRLLDAHGTYPALGTQWDESSLNGVKATCNIVQDGVFVRPEDGSFIFRDSA